MISDRVKKIEESGIRKVFELAASSGDKYVNLSIGQVHFAVPNELKQAGKAAIDNDNNSYTPTMGILGLREKIVEKLEAENNIKAKTEDVMITSGVAGSIFLCLSSIINPGDEVILPDPYFVLYKQVLNYLGAKIVYLDTYPDFRIDEKKLESLVGEKTKLMIINSPNNPTGVVYTEQELRGVARVAKKNNLLVLSDEIYESFDYDDKFFSVGSIYEKTITMNGFSKNFGITGWRIGYVHAPSEIIKAMNKLQQYSFVCAPSFAQYALLSEFDLDLSAEYSEYKKRRDYVLDNLRGYEIVRSDGAFYFFITIPKDRPNFIEELLEQGVLVVSGDVFSEKNDCFRISYAVSWDDLKKGVAILNRMVR